MGETEGKSHGRKGESDEKAEAVESSEHQTEKDDKSKAEKEERMEVDRVNDTDAETPKSPIVTTNGGSNEAAMEEKVANKTSVDENGMDVDNSGPAQDTEEDEKQSAEGDGEYAEVKDICTMDPNFAVICSFIDKFGTACGIPCPSIDELEVDNITNLFQSVMWIRIWTRSDPHSYRSVNLDPYFECGSGSKGIK